MRNIRVFTKKSLSSGIEVELDDFSTKHLETVLRLVPGNPVTIFNGEGGEFKAIIQSSGRRKTIVHVGEYSEINRESPLNIHLGIGLSRGDRMDSIVQKSTEAGVTQISPLFTQRTEVKLTGRRLENKLLHWEKICIGACEQSCRNKIPVINSPIKVNNWVNSTSSEKKLVLDHNGSATISVLRKESNVSSVCLLIGPEGGLSEEEIYTSNVAGFSRLSLGPRIFRTETAPIAAISILQSLWGDIV